MPKSWPKAVPSVDGTTYATAPPEPVCFQPAAFTHTMWQRTAHSQLCNLAAGIGARLTEKQNSGTTRLRWSFAAISTLSRAVHKVLKLFANISGPDAPSHSRMIQESIWPRSNAQARSLCHLHCQLRQLPRLGRLLDATQDSHNVLVVAEHDLCLIDYSNKLGIVHSKLYSRFGYSPVVARESTKQISPRSKHERTPVPIRRKSGNDQSKDRHHGPHINFPFNTHDQYCSLGPFKFNSTPVGSPSKQALGKVTNHAYL